MAIPKKKRRTLIHNGVVYEYCFSGNISIYIRNTITGEECREYNQGSRTVMAHGPGDIKEIIIKQEL